MDKWNPGDLVWCKLRGFAELWPGIVVAESEATAQSLSLRLPDTHLVSFFPDSAFQWVPPDKMFEFEEGYDRYSKMEKGLRSKMWRQGVEEAKELCDLHAGRVPVTHHFSEAPPGDPAASQGGEGQKPKPRQRSSSVETVNKQLPSPRSTVASGEDATKPSSKKAQPLSGTAAPPNPTKSGGVAASKTLPISLKKKRLAVEDESMPPKKKIVKPRPATAPSSSLAAPGGAGSEGRPPKPIKKPRPASALAPSGLKKIKPIARPPKLRPVAGIGGVAQVPLAPAGASVGEDLVPDPPPPVPRVPWACHLVSVLDQTSSLSVPTVMVSDKPLHLPRHPLHAELKPYHSRPEGKRSRLVMTRAMQEYCEISNAWFLGLPPSSSPYADWAGYLRACGIMSDPPPALPSADFPPPPPPPPFPTDETAAEPNNAQAALEPAAEVPLTPPATASAPSPPPPGSTIVAAMDVDAIIIKEEQEQPKPLPLDPPPPPSAPPAPALILKPCTAFEALSWLRNLARGNELDHDLEEGQVEFAKRMAMLTDNKARSKFFDDLAAAAPPPAVATGAGNMDPTIKRSLMHVARVALPSSIGSAIVASSLPSSSPFPSAEGDVTAAAPAPPLSSVEDPSSISVHVVLRINGSILPFISPASLHPPPSAPNPHPAPSSSAPPAGPGPGGGSSRGGGQYQVQGLQGALACFNPCTKFIEGWQLLSPPGLLLLSLEIPDMSKARAPKAPTLPPRPTTLPLRSEQGEGHKYQSGNPLLQKHHQRIARGEDSGADSDTSRGNSNLNRVLKKARQVVNARGSPMKPHSSVKPYDPSKPFEFHFHPYALQSAPQRKALASPFLSGLKKGRGLGHTDPWEEAGDVEVGEETEEDQDIEIEGMSDDELDLRGSRRRSGHSKRSVGRSKGGGAGSDGDYEEEDDDDDGDMDLDDDLMDDGRPRGRRSLGARSSFGLNPHMRSKASLVSPHPLAPLPSLPSFNRSSFTLKPSDLPEVFIHKGPLPSLLLEAANARLAAGPSYPLTRKVPLFPQEEGAPVAIEATPVPPPPAQLTVEIKISDDDDEAYEVVLNNTWGAVYTYSGPNNDSVKNSKTAAVAPIPLDPLGQSTLAYAGVWNRHLAFRKGAEGGLAGSEGGGAWLSQGNGQQVSPLASPLALNIDPSPAPATAAEVAPASVHEEHPAVVAYD